MAYRTALVEAVAKLEASKFYWQLLLFKLFNLIFRALLLLAASRLLIICDSLRHASQSKLARWNGHRRGRALPTRELENYTVTDIACRVKLVLGKVKSVRWEGQAVITHLGRRVDLMLWRAWTGKLRLYLSCSDDH